MIGSGACYKVLSLPLSIDGMAYAMIQRVRPAKPDPLRACVVLIFVCLLGAGCSTLGFSRKDAVFDGTRHAVSSLVCAGYWSDRDWQRRSRKRSFPARVGSTLGLVAYSLVDIPFTFVGDIVGIVPNVLLRSGPASPAFDVQDHTTPWQCGSLQHSIYTIGAM